MTWGFVQEEGLVDYHRYPNSAVSYLKYRSARFRFDCGANQSETVCDQTVRFTQCQRSDVDDSRTTTVQHEHVASDTPDLAPRTIAGCCHVANLAA